MDKPSDPFFVGYLPTPRWHRKFLYALIPALMLVVIAASVLVSRSQPSPGNAIWEDAVKSFSGTLTIHPYPVLHTLDRGDGKAGDLLIVNSGKHGAADRLATLNMKYTSLKGTLLERNGKFMLELDDDPGSATESASSTPIKDFENRSLGPITVRGEILDAKCYLGAMKPGTGKTHKECAILCISGGIPPMLLAHDDSGKPIYYLLADPSGKPLDPDAYPYIADPVEASGTAELIDGLLYLRVRPSEIKRL
jgi:hypothetical protein